MLKNEDSSTRSAQISKKKLATLLEELIKAHSSEQKRDCQDEAFSHVHPESLENYQKELEIYTRKVTIKYAHRISVE